MELDVFHLFIYEPFLFEGTPFEINRVVFLMYVGALACIAFFVIGASKASVKPKGFGLITESAYGLVRNNIALDVIGPEGARYVPLLGTMFYFILFMNIMGITPLINFPVTSRMAIPAFLALLSWVVFNFVGIKRHGFRYFKDTLFPPGMPKLIYVLLTPIELVSVFVIRPVTLAIRLFANLLAGHVLLAVFFLFTEDLLLHAAIPLKPIGILTFVVACLLVIFEMLVSLIQAYIFTTLTAFYIAESLHGHGDHEEGEHAHAGAHAEMEEGFGPEPAVA